MTYIINTANAWYIWPMLALMFGILALAPLGNHVLKRGVVFIDLAVAQAAAAAALWSGVLIDHPSVITYQIAAALGALVCASMVALLTLRAPYQREALIGIVYVVAACITLLAARQNPHGRERMGELLAADVLWVQPWQVVCLATLALLVFLLRHQLQRNLWFYPLFAIAASLAVPTLGLLLVFATLIAPALWQRKDSPALYSQLGAMGFAMMGLLISGLFDAPSCACVAISLGLFGLVSVLWQDKTVA